MGCLGVALILLLVLGGLFVSCQAIYKSTEEWVYGATINRLWTDTSGGGDSGVQTTLLVGTDKGTFKVDDTIVYGRFRSSDVYGALREGETYDFKVYGWRLPFFSTYKNIIEVRRSDASEGR